MENSTFPMETSLEMETNDLSKMENSTFPMETSRQENSQDAVLTPKKKMNGIRLAQEAGTFACKHCPFRTGYKSSLADHEKYHSTNHPFQCNFCTFSSKSELNLVVQHINRVHLEELKTKRKLVQPVNKNEVTNLNPTGEEQPENLSHPKDPVEQNGIPKTAANVEMVEIEEEIVMVREEKLDEMKCFCDQPQPAYGDSSAVTCSQCDDRFHGHCVYITPKVYEQMDELEEPWICPHCLNKEAPTTHKATQSQVVNTSAKKGPPLPRYTSSPLAKSDDGYLERQSQDENMPTTSETPSTLLSLSPQEEEAVFSLERSNLLQEIQTAFEKIMDMKKSLKDEHQEKQMSRSRAANDLREKIEELEKEVHCQSVHLVVLKEQNERFQQKLSELTAKKIQLEQDIINLSPGSVGKIKLKIKLKPIASESSTDFGEEIRRKKNLLKDVKEKLPVVQREKTNLAARIREVEEEMRNNTMKLAKVRDDLESLVGNRDVTRPSAIGVQLKALIGKQQIRIKRFSWLEMKLANISYKLHLDEIRREKERWMDHLMDYNVE